MVPSSKIVFANNVLMWFYLSARHAGRLADNRTPVGSGRVFMHFSSNYRTHVLSHSGVLPSTLFSGALLFALLPPRAERMGLGCVISPFILAQLSTVASIGIEFRVIRDALRQVPHWHRLLTAFYTTFQY